MDEESDEELEDRDEVVESSVHSSSSSEDEDDAEETDVAFWATRAGDSSNFLNFTGPPNGVNRSAGSDINAESSPFPIFVILCYIEQKMYLFLWRSAVSRFKCPENSGQQGTDGI